MIPSPPVARPDESKADTVARLEKIARHLTWFAEEYEARGRSFRERAQEYIDHAANLRGAK